MKRKHWIVLVLAAALLLCCGCSNAVDEQSIIGHTFTYEGEGFGGNFTITIHEDGTFEYYEGALSSYIGTGTWLTEDSVVTLTDDAEAAGTKRQNRFEIKEDCLIWEEKDSGNFLYVKLEDGAVFVKDGEPALQQQAVEAAHSFIEDKFEGSSDNQDNLAVIDYRIDPTEDFEFIRMEDDTYVVRGGYAFTYGYDRQQPILDVTVKADLTVKQDEQGKWVLDEIKPQKIESDGEKKRDGWTNSIDDSSCVPFISKETADDQKMDITQIAQKLVYKLMLELNSYDGEKETFMLNADGPESALEKIEVPDGKKADAVWRFGGNITGSYIGYIKGIEYAGPLLQSGHAPKEQALNQEPLYLVKKADGYYLETSGVFSGRTEGQTVEISKEDL